MHCMSSRLFLALLSATPALAAFPTPQQNIKLSHGQHKATVVFHSDGSTITRAKAHCDCTTLRKDGTRLIAEVDTSRFDSQTEKTIDATTSDGKTTRLTMRFEVPAAIILSDRSLQWKVGSKPTPRVLTITLPPGSPVHDITDAGLSGEHFDYMPKIVKKGQQYTITVTPRSTEKPVLNRLVIKTDSADPRFASQIIYLQVRK